MVKHTQNNLSTVADELFWCVDHFVGLAFKELRISLVNVTKSAGLVIFSEEILKLHFFFAVCTWLTHFVPIFL